MYDTRQWRLHTSWDRKRIGKLLRLAKVKHQQDTQISNCLYFKPKQENEFAVEVLVVVVEAVVLVVAGAEERGDVALEIESLGVDCVTIVVLVVVADVVTRVGVSVLGRLTLEVVALA